MIDKPEDLQVIFNSQDAIDKSFVYKMILKHGIFTDDGDLWRSHRKLLNPSFSPAIIKSFTPLFNQQSRILVKVLAKHLNNVEFDIYQPISACTLEALLSTIFGSNIDIQNDPKSWLLHCVEK